MAPFGGVCIDHKQFESMPDKKITGNRCDKVRFDQNFPRSRQEEGASQLISGCLSDFCVLFCCCCESTPHYSPQPLSCPALISTESPCLLDRRSAALVSMPFSAPCQTLSQPSTRSFLTPCILNFRLQTPLLTILRSLRPKKEATPKNMFMFASNNATARSP